MGPIRDHGISNIQTVVAWGLSNDRLGNAAATFITSG